MAVCRGGTAFWVGCVRSNGPRQPITSRQCSLPQAVVWQWAGQTRPLNSASRALSPPHALRYQAVKQPLLPNPLLPAGHLHKTGRLEEEWEDSLSVCVLVRAREPGGPPTLVEIPLFGRARLGELLTAGAPRPKEPPFTLTTVDGRREDDISLVVRAGRAAGGKDTASVPEREHSTFRNLFRVEKCPAPFVHGSVFYCFHCPGTDPAAVASSATPAGLKRRQAVGLEGRPLEHPLSLSSFLGDQVEGAQGQADGERGDEEEEKMALMYERLRIELPNFFRKSHDYTMYSSDLEFVNGLTNTHTRGRLLYQLVLSLWRVLCLFYYAEARLEVLKLTKHMEDGTIKARWRVHGLPFHSVCLRFYRKDMSQLYRSYDAFSTFYIGHDGLIRCHKVEKVMEARPPLLPKLGTLLAGALVALGVQEHRPALNLLPLFFLSRRQGRD
ncbi:uncharacterized protein C6orf136 homolog [Gadus chalcogrammus]|uniref:uncharacterized protein C6orf136 homolog n=1 Tax=Gadus chalcogrammus TaxID=1042646 RepID=UPI0024C4E3B6|nr:uncharacterized protein C6orf136 homolog [Gadus chalcogrammus]XP_056439230.1 uncharacterized protein C6orf136 homolog [Gadus chalcogrammus]XP_056439231.1 uncharacterized protein C6orf136 homolog [Gadus chalcogrammus]XP_056439232.1 uncharacterized protein C6orf136 homolog [Gadus chalcogrammus]